MGRARLGFEAICPRFERTTIGVLGFVSERTGLCNPSGCQCRRSSIVTRGGLNRSTRWVAIECAIALRFFGPVGPTVRLLRFLAMFTLRVWLTCHLAYTHQVGCACRYGFADLFTPFGCALQERQLRRQPISRYLMAVAWHGSLRSSASRQPPVDQARFPRHF